MKLTRVKHDLIDEISLEIGTFTILSIESNDEDDTFDITLDDSKFNVVIWNGFSLTLVRREYSICIDSLRFYEVIIN